MPVDETRQLIGCPEAGYACDCRSWQASARAIGTRILQGGSRPEPPLADACSRMQSSYSDSFNHKTARRIGNACEVRREIGRTTERSFVGTLSALAAASPGEPVSPERRSHGDSLASRGAGRRPPASWAGGDRVEPGQRVRLRRPSHHPRQSQRPHPRRTVALRRAGLLARVGTGLPSAHDLVVRAPVAAGRRPSVGVPRHQHSAVPRHNPCDLPAGARPHSAMGRLAGGRALRGASDPCRGGGEPRRPRRAARHPGHDSLRHRLYPCPACRCPAGRSDGSGAGRAGGRSSAGEGTGVHGSLPAAGGRADGGRRRAAVEGAPPRPASADRPPLAGDALGAPGAHRGASCHRRRPSPHGAARAGAGPASAHDARRSAPMGPAADLAGAHGGRLRTARPRPGNGLRPGAGGGSDSWSPGSLRR